MTLIQPHNNNNVSTHSRPKAAGFVLPTSKNLPSCFNTQPPEGGWEKILPRKATTKCFNTQPPEGGWLQDG